MNKSELVEVIGKLVEEVRNKKDVLNFMEDKLAPFLVENTTDFGTAAFILQAVQNQLRVAEGLDIIVPREELEEMNKSCMLMDALDGGGVDNWEWYSEAIDDYLKFINEDNGTNYEDLDEAAQALFEEAYGNGIE